VTLSPLDDYPIHQVAEPVRFVGTTDRNFYDRYYFNAFPLDASFALTCGLGTYPNRDVCDAYVAVTRGDTQHVVRASRQLGEDRMDLTCGPLRIEVVEPMRRQRFVVEPTEHGVAVDLTWTASMPAQLEPDQKIRHGAHLTTDTKRFVQTGRIAGTVDVAGARLVVDEAACWGNRDRSWGVRLLGEPEAPGVRGTAAQVGFFWIYAIAQFERFSVVSMIQEDRRGHRSISHAKRYWHDDREPEDLGHPTQRDVELHPGSRRLRRAAIDLVTPNGPVRTLEVDTPGPTSFLGLGTGYGVEPDWRHGMWQGIGPIVQGRSFDLRDPGVIGGKLGLNDNLGRYRFEGEDGLGLLEFSIMGPYEPLGL
jgi:hypothetical protein